MRRGISLVTTALLAGCAFAPLGKIVETSSDYNLAVEKAKNQMYLVNIVRASERRPMYFTSISTLRGSLQSVVSTGNLPIPFGGGDHTSIYSGGPSANYSSNPSFDVGVQDSKPFWQGITSPVPVATLKYYLEQGWPAELVLFLLVRKIEFDGLTFVNYPENPQDMAAFRYVLGSFFGCRDPRKAGECDVHFEETPPDSIGRPLEKNELGNLKSLVETSKEGLKLASSACEPDKYKLVGKAGPLQIASVFSLGNVSQAVDASEQKLCVADTALKAANGKKALDAVDEATEKLDDAMKQLCVVRAKLDMSPLDIGDTSLVKVQGSTRENLERWVKVVKANRTSARDALAAYGCPDYEATAIWKSVEDAKRQAHSGDIRGAHGKLKATQEQLAAVTKRMSGFCIGTTSQSSCNAKAYLRSPEAILYYLGQVVRTGDQVKIQYCKEDGALQPLFFVKKGRDEAKDAAVAVEYEGSTYFIPRDPPADPAADPAAHKCSRNLATQALTLVTQLFALQTDSPQPPATGAVTIVGPLPPR